jgi:hypothetical protein
MDCLKNVIGISRDPETAVTTGMTSDEIAELKLSKSDVYLDEIEGGVNLISVKNALATTELAKIMRNARTQAEQRTAHDIIAGLGNEFEEGKQRYVGALGERVYTKTQELTKRYAGMKLRSQSVDGVVKINEINILLAETCERDLFVYRVNKGAEVGELIKTYSNVAITANTLRSAYSATHVRQCAC